MQDYLLLNLATTDGGAQYKVGQVLQILMDKFDQPLYQVALFCFPEDTKYGRSWVHRDDEIFVDLRSQEQTQAFVSQVIGPCLVLSQEEGHVVAERGTTMKAFVCTHRYSFAEDVYTLISDIHSHHHSSFCHVCHRELEDFGQPQQQLIQACPDPSCCAIFCLTCRHSLGIPEQDRCWVCCGQCRCFRCLEIATDVVHKYFCEPDSGSCLRIQDNMSVLDPVSCPIWMISGASRKIEALNVVKARDSRSLILSIQGQDIHPVLCPSLEHSLWRSSIEPCSSPEVEVDHDGFLCFRCGYQGLRESASTCIQCRHSIHVKCLTSNDRRIVSNDQSDVHQTSSVNTNSAQIWGLYAQERREGKKSLCHVDVPPEAFVGEYLTKAGSPNHHLQGFICAYAPHKRKFKILDLASAQLGWRRREKLIALGFDIAPPGHRCRYCSKDASRNDDDVFQCPECQERLHLKCLQQASVVQSSHSPRVCLYCTDKVQHVNPEMPTTSLHGISAALAQYIQQNNFEDRQVGQWLKTLYRLTPVSRSDVKASKLGKRLHWLATHAPEGHKVQQRAAFLISKWTQDWAVQDQAQTRPSNTIPLSDGKTLDLVYLFVPEEDEHHLCASCQHSHQERLDEQTRREQCQEWHLVHPIAQWPWSWSKGPGKNVWEYHWRGFMHHSIEEESPKITWMSKLLTNLNGHVSSFSLGPCLQNVQKVPTTLSECARTQPRLEIEQRAREWKVRQLRGASVKRTKEQNAAIHTSKSQRKAQPASQRSNRAAQRMFQKHTYAQHQLVTKKIRFGKSAIHSWGVFADEPLGKDDLICEYKGEIIRNIVADAREAQYVREEVGSDYMFRVDTHTVIDATKRGGLARFLNHSCAPNCYTQIIQHLGQKKICIYAKHAVDMGEELCYDYQFPIEEVKIPCHCQALTCRGTLN